MEVVEIADNVVYTTKTISTIVDNKSAASRRCCLYDQNNFYYCRSKPLLIYLITSIRPKQFLLL